MSRLGGSLAIRLFTFFLLLSLVPLGILVLLTSRTGRRVEEAAIRAGSDALIEEAKGYQMQRTIDFARRINLKLGRIGGDARVLAAEAAGLLGRPELYRVPWTEGRYERAGNGIFWTPRDDGGSNLFVSRGVPLTPALRRRIALTELLDSLLRSIYENDENSTYVFFAGIDNLIRGYPWFDALAAIEGGTLEPDLDVNEEPLFYLARADSASGGVGGEVWSEVYLDVAGRGWMVTCVVPVRAAGRFLGIVGIDVSLDRIRENVLDLEAGGGGYAFLLTRAGNVLAAPPEAMEGMGWEVGTTPDRFNLLASTNASLASLARGMVSGGAEIGQVSIAGREMLVSYAPVETAGWSLAQVVPVNEIIGRALTTAREIEGHTGALLRHMKLLSALIVGAAAVVTILLSRRITGPLNELVRGASQIGGGDLGCRVRTRGDDEVGKLARTFNDMAESLQRRDRELRRVQRALLDSERLSSMGKVAAAVAHEIRNSLGTIKNSIYYLRGRIDPSDGQVERHLSLMEEEIGAADEIVSELLDFTRGSPLKFTDVAVNTLVREVLDVFREREGDRVRFTEELADDLPRIQADPVQLRHVFYNVIQNACQAIDGEGGVHLRTEAREGGVRVTIRDSGRGIPEEDRPRLFEPFFTTRARGIGLGLAISRRIVEGHGGEIGIDDDPSGGATARIDLPARPGGECTGP